MLGIFNIVNVLAEALVMLLRAGAVALAIIIAALIVGSAAVSGTLFGIYEGWTHRLMKLRRR